MWGSSLQIPVATGGFTAGEVTQQLSRISYARPETWSFLFAARLIAAARNNPVQMTITVDFVLNLGIGRSSLDVDDRAPTVTTARPAFCRLAWSIGGAAVIPIGGLKWTSTVPSPPLDESRSLGAVEYPVTHFPAQDIQCSARVTFRLGAPAVATATVQVHSYFAPRTHVRPDWFADKNMFRGNEIGGT